MESEARRARFRSMSRRCAESARRWSRRCPHRDAKLLIGRDTRESGVWIERELAYGARLGGRNRAEHRRGAHAGGGVSDGLARLRRRRRDFGVAQSLSGQRHQGVLGRRRQVRRAVRGRESKQLVADSPWRCPPATRPTCRTPSISASIWIMRAPCCPDLDELGPRAAGRRLRQRRDDDRGAGAVPRAWVRRHGARSGAGRTQYQQGRRIDTSGKAG